MEQKQSKIQVTPDEFSCLVEMFMDWEECKYYEWDREEIHDKRHNIERRKKSLKMIYDEALRVELVRMILYGAEIINASDEDDPWVSNDFENIVYSSPINRVRYMAQEAGLEEWLKELEGENGR
ncbi:hypothetical protein IJ098_00420 [Candidatus Saccharibacteria bacterium]|nr:hypothetical protein [Candidatus Saccharibacteria bacterium]